MEKSTICVTGAASYLGSSLVKKLLEKGHFVHGTLRNLGDEAKVQTLKDLSGADLRLSLFEAEIYEPESFKPAIQGCQFVFLVATPFQHVPNSSKYKDTSEASLAAIRNILRICEESNTVKKVIYTASVLSASPIKDDGITYKEYFDETCWTSLNVTSPQCDEFMKDYIDSKTLSEKEILCYNNRDDRKFDVISLACAVVAGDTSLPYLTGSQICIMSPIISIEKESYIRLKVLQVMFDSIPLVHIDDVSEAFIFCIENHSISGRFLCVAVKPSIHEIREYYYDKGLKIRPEPDEEVVEDWDGMVYCKALHTKCMERDVMRFPTNKDKLCSLGFRYNKSFESILDDNLECAKRLGFLKFASELNG